MADSAEAQPYITAHIPENADQMPRRERSTTSDTRQHQRRASLHRKSTYSVKE
jgi:hypothetical protein